MRRIFLKRGRGGGPKAVRRLSENSSVVGTADFANIDDEDGDSVGGGDVNDETNCGCREEIFV